jgi:hypothetical protein
VSVFETSNVFSINGSRVLVDESPIEFELFTEETYYLNLTIDYTQSIFGTNLNSPGSRFRSGLIKVETISYDELNNPLSI